MGVFSDGLFSLAEVKVVGLSGVRGIGVNRLQFSLELNMAATPDYSASLSDPRCFVSASRTQNDPPLPIGQAVPETCWFRETSQYASREVLGLVLYLTGEQLEQLERMRGGGALFFRLDLHAVVKGKHGLQRSFEQLWFEASLSCWSAVLGQVGYLDLLLLAVELPVSGVPAEFKAAVEQLRDAYRDLVAGSYDPAVSRIRLCIESIDKVTAADARRDAAIECFKTTPKRMSKPQRADLVRAAIRHYTHLAHHVGEEGAPEYFSRHEALFILSAAAALIWDVIATAQSR